jgi:hypothetical protein
VVSLPSPVPVGPFSPGVSVRVHCLWLSLATREWPCCLFDRIDVVGQDYDPETACKCPGAPRGPVPNFSSVFQDRALVVHKMSHCLGSTPSYQHVLLGVDRRGSAPARTILAACIMKYDSLELVHLDTGSVNELPSSELFMKTSKRLFLVVGGHRSSNSRSPCGLQYHCPKAGERLVDCLPVLP